MELNLEDVKDYIYGLKGKYAEKYSELNAFRGHEKLAKGIEAVETTRELLDGLGEKVKEGHLVLRGTAQLMAKQEPKTDLDKEALEHLADIYHGNQGLIKRMVCKVKGDKPTLEDSLEVIKDVADQIVPYVHGLTGQLVKRREELSQLRADLRQNVEDQIMMRLPLEQDISNIETNIMQLESEYNTLESTRVTNAVGRETTDSSIIEKLGLLELALGGMRDTYVELKAKRKGIESNIEISNGQVEKVGQLLEQFANAQEVVYGAKDFVDIQVPYVLGEICTQQTQIRALTGVNRVSQFLEEQQEVSRQINDRIKIAVGYLDKKVDQLRDNTVKNPSIYTLAGKNQNQKYLLH